MTSTPKYTVRAARKTAALYLAWEFGVKQAREMLTRYSTRGGMVDLTPIGPLFLAEYRSGRYTLHRYETGASPLPADLMDRLNRLASQRMAELRALIY